MTSKARCVASSMTCWSSLLRATSRISGTKPWSSLSGTSVASPGRAAAQGELLFFTCLSDAARQFFARNEIPMASPRTILSPEPVVRAVTAVLARERIGPKDLKLPLRIEGIFFKPYLWQGIVHPGKLRLSRPEPDELHRGKLRLGADI